MVPVRERSNGRPARMAAAGLSPLLSLQSVSVNAAALLGIDDRVGQIRPGYAADFVAVAADPLAGLHAMRTISLVTQGGRVVREDAR
jgi:imidazolonepropionase-like amidohydrolase